MLNPSLPESTIAQVPLLPSLADLEQPPWRLLLAAVGWLLLSLAMQFLFSFFSAFVVGVHNGIAARNGGQPWAIPSWLQIMLAICVLQLTMLWAAWKRSLAVGRGSRRVGLGITPLRRPRLLLSLSIIAVPLVYLWVLAIHHLIPTALPPVLTMVIKSIPADTSHLAPKIILMLTTGLLAPVAEELFFRGWLWTGLRRHWNAGVVSLATGCFWLVPHFTEGLSRGATLIPLAILLSVARHYCDSVLASITLHLVNNVFFMMLALSVLL